MARSDNSYSQFVALAKIVLPIIGLGMLSSLFLLSDSPQSERELPYSDVELEDIVQGQRILTPRYQTTLPNGAAIDVSAETARPDPDTAGRYLATEIAGRMYEQSGVEFAVRSAEAELDQRAGTVRLIGGVRIARNDGLMITTERLNARVDGTFAQTPGQVVIKAPGLSLSAGRSQVSFDPVSRQQVIVFNDGVRVLYSQP